MRDKIKARLKEKFPGVNLSSKRLDDISDKLSKKITEESEIDAKLDEINELMPLAEIARQDDRLRTLESKSKDKQPTPANTDSNSNQDADDMPGWFKKHVEETNKKLAEIEARNLQGSMQSRLAKDLKDIPAKFYSRAALPDKEDDYAAFVEGVKTDYQSFIDEQVEKGLMSAAKPANASGGASATDKQVDEDIKAWAQTTGLATQTK